MKGTKLGSSNITAALFIRCLFLLFVSCFFTLGNIGLPATSSFVGEILILVGCFEANSWATLFAGLGMILGIGYSLWLCNRIAFGNSKQFSIWSLGI